MMQKRYSPMRFPSFSSFIEFEAVERHRTLMRAMTEINVSPLVIGRRLGAPDGDFRGFPDINTVTVSTDFRLTAY